MDRSFIPTLGSPGVGTARPLDGPSNGGSRSSHTAADAGLLRPAIRRSGRPRPKHPGRDWKCPAPTGPDASTVVETIGGLTIRDRVVVPQRAVQAPNTTVPAAPVIDPAALIRGLAAPSGSEFAWMVPASQPVSILSAAATGRAIGASVVAYDPANILRYPVSRTGSGRTAPIRDPLPGRRAHRNGLGDRHADQRRAGAGRRFSRFFPRLCPEDMSRSTGTRWRGGSGPSESRAPPRPWPECSHSLAEYAADGAQVIPTFEIIASVAAAGPTDGDYSEESSPESLAAWIQFARENGMYVILDLQPGREDFLTQAKQYEELLKLPNVGLALDPEWRLLPDQVHLRQIGRVGAAEVNTVVNWLADLVKTNGLPQKMLIVHQFKSTMIVNRERLKQRPELQMVIQMDGQGPIPTKDDTYAFLTAGTEEAHWKWGWKNFFDEDSPETRDPAYTIDHSPVPVFVSYQ